MLDFVEAKTQDEIARFCTLPGSHPLTSPLRSMQEADAHWMVMRNDTIVARCSLWWSVTPPYPPDYESLLIDPEGGKLGLIGHYAATDDEAGQRLLRHACDQLAQQRCTLAVGPLDGNTFRHYRLLTGRNVDGRCHPPFFLEPDNPDSWPGHFAAAGFQPLAHYFSAYGELPVADPHLPALAQRMAKYKVAIRPVNLENFAAELRRIYQIVSRSFVDNFLYQPIDQAEFMAQYALLRPFIQPELVLIAEQMGEPVGFLFALPDLAEAQRGEVVDTVILKTLGVVPELAGIGLGGFLTASGQSAARQLGYRHVIHALMFEDNLSRKISERYAQVMRRYTLFARRVRR